MSKPKQSDRTTYNYTKILNIYFYKVGYHAWSITVTTGFQIGLSVVVFNRPISDIFIKMRNHYNVMRLHVSWVILA